LQIETNKEDSDEEEESEDKAVSRYLNKEAMGGAKRGNQGFQNRLSKFEVSDGDHTIQCMEYETLRHIPELVEGVLLFLVPPIEVRRGIFMLKVQNV
jgi:hypothetical protein